MSNSAIASAETALATAKLAGDKASCHGYFQGGIFWKRNVNHELK